MALAATHALRAAESSVAAKVGLSFANSREACAATAATSKVAAVEGRCSARGFGSSLGSIGGDGPLCVVDLVVHHPGKRLTVRHHHCKQELQLPSRLVEQIGNAVAAFGNARKPIAEDGRGSTAKDTAALECRQQLRDRDRTVDRVFAVVAGIVPAAGNVETIGAGPVAIERLGLVASQAAD